MGTLRFSGHESFQCRNLWLKKGYDYLKSEKSFTDDLAVVELGVGNNMVTSVRYWLDAFGIRDENEKSIPSILAEKVLDDDGWDPFLEDIGSLWLFHYELVSNKRASIYSLVFNKFRRQRIEFHKSHLKDFIIHHCNENDESHSPNTIETDVGVFLKSYVWPSAKEDPKNIEDQFSSLLIELDLVKKVEADSKKKTDWYKIESSERQSLPIEIFFYCILDNIEKGRFGKSISLHKLLNDENSPGNSFVMYPDALVSKVIELTELDDNIVYKEDAGVRELQLNREFDKYEILERYYGRN